MTRFEVTFKEVLGDYPEIVEEFMNNLRNSNSEFKDIDLERIDWYYSWDFIYDEESEEEFNRFELKYEDRLEYEMDKVRVNVTMKAGEFKRRDRVSSVKLPSDVVFIVNEVIKIMMLEEQKFFTDEEISESIPPLNTNMNEYGESLDFYKSYVNISTINGEYIDENYTYDYEYIPEEYDGDEDTILDKIFKEGIDSLTKGEKKFLDEISKSK